MELPPLPPGTQSRQPVQQAGPQPLRQPGIGPHCVHGGLDLLGVQGAADGVPAPLLARAKGHGEAPLVHGGQVPVNALALHGHPRLGQLVQQLLHGQGVVFVGLLIQNAGQAQGPVPLVRMFSHVFSSCLWITPL